MVHSKQPDTIAPTSDSSHERPLQLRDSAFEALLGQPKARLIDTSTIKVVKRAAFEAQGIHAQGATCIGHHLCVASSLTANNWLWGAAREETPKGLVPLGREHAASAVTPGHIIMHGGIRRAAPVLKAKLEDWLSPRELEHVCSQRAARAHHLSPPTVHAADSQPCR